MCAESQSCDSFHQCKMYRNSRFALFMNRLSTIWACTSEVRPSKPARGWENRRLDVPRFYHPPYPYGSSIGSALGLQKPRLLKCVLALFGFVIESYCKSITPSFVHIKGRESAVRPSFFANGVLFRIVRVSWTKRAMPHSPSRQSFFLNSLYHE